jgi:hypothetical protein
MAVTTLNKAKADKKRLPPLLSIDITSEPPVILALDLGIRTGRPMTKRKASKPAEPGSIAHLPGGQTAEVVYSY